MSFSFCFSPMRRATLFALASSFLAAVVFAAGNAFSFLVFVIVAASNAFSFWLCGTRCRQCSSHFGFVVLAAGNAFSFFGVVAFAAGNAFSFLALWHSVPERAFYGTEYAFGAQNRLLWYATHFQRHSVQKTGVSGVLRQISC